MPKIKITKEGSKVRTGLDEGDIGYIMGIASYDAYDYYVIFIPEKKRSFTIDISLFDTFIVIEPREVKFKSKLL